MMTAGLNYGLLLFLSVASECSPFHQLLVLDRFRWKNGLLKIWAMSISTFVYPLTIVFDKHRDSSVSPLLVMIVENFVCNQISIHFSVEKYTCLKRCMDPSSISHLGLLCSSIAERDKRSSMLQKELVSTNSLRIVLYNHYASSVSNASIDRCSWQSFFAWRISPLWICQFC